LRFALSCSASHLALSSAVQSLTSIAPRYSFSTMDIDLPPIAMPTYPSPPFCFKSLPAELRCSVIESFSSSANPSQPADLDTLRSLSLVDRECSRFACSVLWRVSRALLSFCQCSLLISLFLPADSLRAQPARRIPLQDQLSARDLPSAHRAPSPELDQRSRFGRSVPKGADG
jgi:hypothetical protein